MTEQTRTMTRSLFLGTDLNLINKTFDSFTQIFKRIPVVTSHRKSRLRLIWIYDQMASECWRRGDAISARGHEQCADALRETLRRARQTPRIGGNELERTAQ